jgi:hypothetical protein
MTIGVRTLFAALCALHCALAQADAKPQWGLPELMRDLGAVTSVRAKFVETKYFNTLSAPLMLSGTLAYRAPDWLEKHTRKPVAERLVLEGDSLTIEDPRRTRRYALERNPPIRMFVESIRSTLAGDAQTLGRFYDIALLGDTKRWQLVLKPIDEAMRSMVSEIRIAGRGTAIDRMEVLAAGGDRSVMEISPDTP